MNPTLPVLSAFICAFALVTAHAANQSLDEAADGVGIRLMQTLKFENREISGSIAPEQVEAFLDDKPFGDKGVTLRSPQDEREKAVSTCRQWGELKREHWYADSDRQMFADGMFIRTCGVLFEIAKARLATQSFISDPRVGVSSIDMIPATLLPVASDNDRSELSKSGDSGATYGSMIQGNRVSSLSIAPNSLEIYYPTSGMWQGITEVARADFDGDGVEDILAIVEEQAMPGTLQSTSLVLLSRTSHSAKFTVRDACENDAALC